MREPQIRSPGLRRHEPYSDTCQVWSDVRYRRAILSVSPGVEVDAKTVLQWLVEAAEQLHTFSQHFLHEVRVQQVQLDELFALLSAVKAGEVSAVEAIEHLERAPQWVRVAKVFQSC